MNELLINNLILQGYTQEQIISIIKQPRPKPARKQKKIIRQIQEPTHEPTPPAPIVIEPTKKQLWRQYRQKAWQITNAQPLHLLENYEKRGFKNYHLDHILSIWNAFHLNLPPETVGHISNLRMIPHKDNTNKGRKSHFTDLFGNTIKKQP